MGMMIPKPTSGITDELKEAFDKATPFEVRLATALIYYPNKEEALEAVKADKKLLNDYKLWSNVDALTVAIRNNLVNSAVEMMQQHLPQAVQVLLGGLASSNEKVRLQTAKYLTERFLGKPTTHTVVDLKTKTETVHYHISGIDPDMWDDNNVVEGEYERTDQDTLLHGTD